MGQNTIHTLISLTKKSMNELLFRFSQRNPDPPL